MAFARIENGILWLEEGDNLTFWDASAFRPYVKVLKRTPVVITFEKEKLWDGSEIRLLRRVDTSTLTLVNAR